MKPPNDDTPRAAVFAAGDLPTARLLPGLLEAVDLVVAADAGLAHVHALGLRPQAIVGDFDSVDPDLLELYRDVPLERHRVDKDELDLELALNSALGLGAHSVRVLGAFGGRLDHSLASLLVAARRAAGGLLISLHGGSHEAHFCNPAMPLKVVLEPGTTVSLLALRGDAVVDSRGLRFPLNATKLAWGSGLGISNVVVEPAVELHCSSGAVALIIEHEV